MTRRRFHSGSLWERRFSYARAVRSGPFVAISGTVSADAEGQVVGKTAYEQTRQILRGFGKILGDAGGSLADIVRLRVHYVASDVADGFSRALSEAFPDGAPALTTVRVAGLVSAEFLVEIEADAFIETGREGRDADIPDWDEEAD